MHSTHLLLCTLIATSLFAACSVKEDRKVCPCHLTVDFNDSNTKMPGGMVHLKFQNGDGGKTHRTSLPAIEKKYQTSLPKGNIHLFASTGGKSWNIGEDSRSLFIKTGNQADSIYAYVDVVECFDETAETIVHFYKQWCTILLILEKPEVWESSLFELSGEWSGLSTEDLAPVPGNFICTAKRLSADRLEAKIPRQGNDSLVLKIFQTEEEGSKGKLIQTFPLGGMISATGFDWKEKNLGDIVLKIKHVETGVSIDVLAWKNGENDTDIKI